MSQSPSEPGRAGAECRAGADGVQGTKGDAGKSGPAGPAGPSATTKLLVMFIFVVLIFIFLAWRIQMNTDEIEEARLNQEISRCGNNTDILTKFNRFLTEMAEVERAGIESGEDPAVTPTRKERIRIYEQTLIDLPDCSRLPRP